MSKISLPTLFLSSICLLNDVHAAENEIIDFSQGSAPAAPTPAPAMRLNSGEIELGGGYNTEESFKFGEYSGLQNRGGFFIGNLHLQQRAHYDSNSTDYWKIIGRNLGLSSRFIRGEYGQQGRGKLFFSYNQTPHFRWDDAKTPFILSGNTLNLPFDWVPADNTADMTNLNPSLQPINIATKRRKYHFGASWRFNSQWGFNIQYFHEKKNGLDVTAGIFGTTGGNPLAAILSRPINQVTNDVSAELNFSNLKSQFSMRYHLSLFDNNIDALTWQNPYSLRAPLLTAYPDQGRIGLEPDNQAHQVSLNFGHRLNNTTRLTGVFSYGWMLQNQDFLPYTVNPNLIVARPLPRNSLDAHVNNLHGNLTFTARPMKKANVRARYIYTERDNQTPINIYTILRNDSENQDTSLNSALNRINLPYGYRKHNTQFDLSYRLFTMTKIVAGYDFERYERDYAEVANTNEHTGRIKLMVNPYHFMNTRLEYAHSRRTGSEYRDNRLFIDSHTQNFLESLPINQRFSNNPSLRKFQYSDRIQSKVTLSLILIPTDKLTLGLIGYYTHDNYDAKFGLSKQNRFSGTLDINYAFSKNIDFHGFYTQEYFLSKQNGFARRSALEALPPLDVNNFWWLDNKDNVYTTGAGFNWIVIENKLDIELNYLFSRAVTEINPEKSMAAAVALPNITTNIHSLNFRSNYHLKENLRLRFNYRYESFHTKDVARDNIEPDTIAQVISLGSSSPDYNAHVAGLSMVLNF